MTGGDEWRGELEHVVSDPELITAVRAGDRAAFGELYRRHVGPATTLARQFARTPAEADDLVSEAFARVLDQLLTGHGPDTAFRAYLFTSLRNTAYDRTRKDRRLQFTDDMTGHDQPVVGDDPVVARVESGLVAAAFARLPERWQAVLWHTQVEGESPAAVGALLGMAPGAVSSLAFRAREGLREAYLQAHLADTAGETCRTTVERLGAWTRGGLSKREKAQVDAHLAGCDRCRTLAAELQEVNTGLRALLAPVLLGAAAAGYLATLGPVAPMAALGLLGATAPAGVGGAAMTGTGSGGAVSAGTTAGAASGASAGTAGAVTGTAGTAGTVTGTLGTAGTVTGTGSLGAAATAGAASGAATGAAGSAVGITTGAAHLVGATGVVATSTVAGVGAGAGVATAGVIGVGAGAGAAAAGAATVGGAIVGTAAVAGTAAAGAAVAGASLATTGLLAVGTAAAAAAVTGSVIALSDVAPTTTVDTAAGTTISAAPTSTPPSWSDLSTGTVVVSAPADPTAVPTDLPLTTPAPVTDVPLAVPDGGAVPSVEPSDQLALEPTYDPSTGTGADSLSGTDLGDLIQLAGPTVPVATTAPVVPVVPIEPVVPVVTTSPAPAPPATPTPTPQATPTPTPDPQPSTPVVTTEQPPNGNPATGAATDELPPSNPSPSNTTTNTTAPTGTDDPAATTNGAATTTAQTEPTDTGQASSTAVSTDAPASSTPVVEPPPPPPPPVLPVVQLPAAPLSVTAGTTASVDVDLVGSGTDGGTAGSTTAFLDGTAGLAVQTVDVRTVGSDGGSSAGVTTTCAAGTRCAIELPAVPANGRVALAVTMAVAADAPSTTQLSVTVGYRTTAVPVTVVPALPATPQATLTVADGTGLTAGVPVTAALTADRPGPITLSLRSGDLWVVGHPDQCQADGDRLTCPGPTVEGLTLLPRPGAQGPVQPSVSVDGQPATATGPGGAALVVAPRTAGAPLTVTGPFGGTMVAGSADPAGTGLTIPADATVFWAELTWTTPINPADAAAPSDGDPGAQSAGDPGVDLVRGDRTTRVAGVVPAGAPADGIRVHTADVTAALATDPTATDRVTVVPVGDTPADGFGWVLTVVWSAPDTPRTTVSTAGALAAPLADSEPVSVLSAPSGSAPVLSGWATIWRADAGTAVSVRPPGCPSADVSSGLPTAVVAFGACPPPSGDGGPQTPAADLTVSAATPADARRAWAGPALVIRPTA